MLPPSVDRQARYLNVLRLAARTLGGETRLASFLRIPRDQLRVWLDGSTTPPLEVFLDSLDIVADGPYAPHPRPVRVAVIDQRVHRKHSVRGG